MDVGSTLQRYRGMIDAVLGDRGGELERIIRRGAVADSLAYGHPTGQVAIPRYAPGLSATSAPASSEEALGDLMLALRSRASGSPGQSPAPPDFGRIYANRAQNQLAQQALMDERAVREAGMINEQLRADQGLRSNLALGGANAGLREAEIARRRAGHDENVGIPSQRLPERGDRAS